MVDYFDCAKIRHFIYLQHIYFIINTLHNSIFTNLSCQIVRLIILFCSHFSDLLSRIVSPVHTDNLHFTIVSAKLRQKHFIRRFPPCPFQAPNPAILGICFIAIRNTSQRNRGPKPWRFATVGGCRCSVSGKSC